MAASVASREMPSETIAKVNGIIISAGDSFVLPAKYEGEGVHSDLIRSLLKVQHIHRGRVTCIFTVKPYVCVISLSFSSGDFTYSVKFSVCVIILVDNLEFCLCNLWLLLHVRIWSKYRSRS